MLKQPLLARRFKLTLPLLAAISARLAQFVTLIIVAHLAVGNDKAVVITTFGLLASFAMITDSGAAMYLLSTAPQNLTVSAFRFAVQLQLGTAAFGACVAVAVGTARQGIQSNIVILLVASLALTQTFESTLRAARAPLLSMKRDGRSALPEVLLSITKTPMLASAIVLESLIPVILIPMLSFVALVLTYRAVGSGIVVNHRVAAQKMPWRSILTFGLSGSASTLYSQTPLVFASAILGPVAAAPLAILYRVFQPLEVFPSTITQQLIPRLRDGTVSTRRTWGFCVLIALPLTSIAVASLPILARVMEVPRLSLQLGVILAFAAIFKFGNYAFVAKLLAQQWLWTRLLVTLAVGVITVFTVLYAIHIKSIEAVGIATVLSELILACCLALVLFSRSGVERCRK